MNDEFTVLLTIYDGPTEEEINKAKEVLQRSVEAEKDQYRNGKFLCTKCENISPLSEIGIVTEYKWDSTLERDVDQERYFKCPVCGQLLRVPKKMAVVCSTLIKLFPKNHIYLDTDSRRFVHKESGPYPEAGL